MRARTSPIAVRPLSGPCVVKARRHRYIATSRLHVLQDRRRWDPAIRSSLAAIHVLLRVPPLTALSMMHRRATRPTFRIGAFRTPASNPSGISNRGSLCVEPRSCAARMSPWSGSRIAGRFYDVRPTGRRLASCARRLTVACRPDDVTSAAWTGGPAGLGRAACRLLGKRRDGRAAHYVSPAAFCG